LLLFSDISISQGSVATYLRCAGMFSDNVIVNFMLRLRVK